MKEREANLSLALTLKWPVQVRSLKNDPDGDDEADRLGSFLSAEIRDVADRLFKALTKKKGYLSVNFEIEEGKVVRIENDSD